MTKVEFNHVPVSLPPLQTRSIDKKRFYITPEGAEYPSITTVLSSRNKAGLHEWRKRVGDEVANYVSGKAASRGTKVHHMCEDYLNNMAIKFPSKWAKHKKDFFPYCLFTQLQEKVLQNIDDIYAQEAGLYSDKYKVAGRVDCVSEYNGVPSVIDFKTSTKERKDDWNENYYIQGSAYAEMFQERTGIVIDQVVILVVTEDGTVQEFVKCKHDYLDALTETVTEWRNQNETPNNSVGGVSVDGMSNN
jgi:genome maintenance exonuclease 1